VPGPSPAMAAEVEGALVPAWISDLDGDCVFVSRFWLAALILWIGCAGGYLVYAPHRFFFRSGVAVCIGRGVEKGFYQD